MVRQPLMIGKCNVLDIEEGFLRSHEHHMAYVNFFVLQFFDNAFRLPSLLMRGTCVPTLVVFVAFASTAQSDEPPPPMAEAFLHKGNFAEGIRELQGHLAQNPTDDEARFGLACLQYFHAFETFGHALYQHGALSLDGTFPALHFVVPPNGDPLPMNIPKLRNIVNDFRIELARMDETLASIRNDKVKLRLRMAQVRFDFTGNGRAPILLGDSIFNRLPHGVKVLNKNPDLRIHFDRSDVDFLRAYCHLFAAVIDVIHSVDAPHLWDQVGVQVFPAWVASDKKAIEEITIADPRRIQNMRLHLVSVCKLLRESIKFARWERDFDFEWFPSLGRPNVFGYSISKEKVVIYNEAILEIEGVLRGDILIPLDLLSLVIQIDRLPNFHKIKTKSLSVQKLLDSVPPDLLMISASDRWNREGIPEQYFEESSKKPSLKWDRIQNGFSFLLEMFRGD